METKKLSTFKEKSDYNYNKAMRLVELVNSDKDIRKDKALDSIREFVETALTLEPCMLSKIAKTKLEAAQVIDANINLFHNDKEKRIMNDEQFDKITLYSKEIDSNQDLLYTDKYFGDARIKKFTIYDDSEDYLQDQLTDDERFSTGSSKFLAGVKPGSKVDSLLDDKLRNDTDDIYNALEIKEINEGDK